MSKTMHLVPGPAPLATLQRDLLVQRYQPHVLEAMLQRRIHRSAEKALDELGDDSVLFLPRKDHLSPKLSFWCEERRTRFLHLLEQHLTEEFAELEANWSEASITLTESLWPQVEAQLRELALRGLATRWILRKLGDAVILGDLAPHDEGWRAPLHLRGQAETVGWLTLDASGNIVEEQTASRNDLQKPAHAA